MITTRRTFAFSLFVSVFTISVFLMGCASTDSPPNSTSQTGDSASEKNHNSPYVEREAVKTKNASTPKTSTVTSPATSTRNPAVPVVPDDVRSAAPGELRFDVADVAGRRLRARLDIRDTQDRRLRLVDAPTGVAFEDVPAGPWKVHSAVYAGDAPVVVDIRTVEVKAGGVTPVEVRVLEGASGNRSLREFDRDFDLVLDRVELQEGTDPGNAASMPGIKPIQWPSPVLSNKGRWYAGDMHTHSSHGIGSESVADLVRRAERSGLDFLAITDRNTLAAAFDPGFNSRSVVLIPGMEWGNDENGVALVYAPATVPEPPGTFGSAQAMLYRLQAQGGLIFAAHPLFANAPWQWGLAYLNGVETWCRPWNAPPPLALSQLNAPMTERREGDLIHSIALAAATEGYSANGQATWFYDSELTRGLKAAMIAGSYSVGPEVPLGQPLTYVFANEQSLHGIMDGLRWGRSFVTTGRNGPKVSFMADILVDETIDTNIGGYVPLNVRSLFRVEVGDAKVGMTLEILLNGAVFRSTKIRWDGDFAYEFEFVPENYATFRARIIGPSQPGAFGVTEMLAMTSPIYALEVIPDLPGDDDNIWLSIDHDLYTPGAADRLPGNPATDRYRTISPSHRF